MDVNFHTVVLNVATWRNRSSSTEASSTSCYRAATGYRAALVHEDDGRQVVVLREVERSALHPAGGAMIGPRLVGFEVASLESLELIEQRLEQRQAPSQLVGNLGGDPGN